MDLAVGDEVGRIKQLLRDHGLTDESRLLEISQKMVTLDYSSMQLEKMQEQDVDRMLDELNIKGGLAATVRIVLRRFRKSTMKGLNFGKEEGRESSAAYTDKGKANSDSRDPGSVQVQQIPVQNSKGPEVAEWSDAAVGYFLDFFSEKYLQLKRANFKSKDWQEVVLKLNSHCGEQRYQYDYKQCKNKLDSLKKKYKAEKERVIATGVPSRWKWYSRIEELTGGAGGHQRVMRGIPGGIDSGERKAPPADSALMDDEFPSEDESDDRDISLASEMACEGNSSFQKEKDYWYSMDGKSARSPPPFLGHGDISAATAELSSQRAKGSPLPVPHAKACRKRRRGSFHASGKEIARIVTDALEKMEERRLEFLKELERERNKVELRRTEVQLEIAKLVLKSKRKRKDQDSDDSE